MSGSTARKGRTSSKGLYVIKVPQIQGWACSDQGSAPHPRHTVSEHRCDHLALVHARG